jgi:hypothetical protein
VNLSDAITTNHQAGRRYEATYAGTMALSIESDPGTLYVLNALVSFPDWFFTDPVRLDGLLDPVNRL